jgi:hypothetical protein
MKRFTSFVPALFAVSIPVLVASVASSSALVSACSTPADSCSVYVPPAGSDLTTPVHFKADVLPILVNSCAFSSCHGAPNGSNQGLYLGEKPPASSDTERIYKAAVGVPASELPTMSYIAPGDTANSYLLHKIDGDMCAVKCTDPSCNVTMPQGGDLLEPATRDVIRRWVLQGAKND